MQSVTATCTKGVATQSNKSRNGSGDVGSTCLPFSRLFKLTNPGNNGRTTIKTGTVGACISLFPPSLFSIFIYPQHFTPYPPPLNTSASSLYLNSDQRRETHN
ncbi:hypothetical protein L2E82_12632 [Cichorium intybus]|uniref:Uncharacterized protein n=1 Tax=Cichorium intybus TaxID=13427 RepID=A0ACB9GHP2_CICIN|nr:hypothetical protein L2E82_12632 [Cichorium intybus]